MLAQILEFARGMVRPTVTWGGFGALVVMLFLGIDVPQWYQAMIALLLGYWFAHRDANGRQGR